MLLLDQETNIYPSSLLGEFIDNDGDRRWWAVYTKSRQEKALARQLQAHTIPFYLPLIPKERLVRRQRVRSFVPLFDGYLFLYSTDEERVTTLTTNRVSRILPVEDQQELRRDLAQVCELISSDIPLTVEGRLQPGDRVRVKQGSLAGLEGTVVRRAKVQRLLISVNYLQQGVSVEIDDFMLEPV